jgi:hypothetical protein
MCDCWAATQGSGGAAPDSGCARCSNLGVFGCVLPDTRQVPTRGVLPVEPQHLAHDAQSGNCMEAELMLWCGVQGGDEAKGDQEDIYQKYLVAKMALQACTLHQYITPVHKGQGPDALQARSRCSCREGPDALQGRSRCTVGKVQMQLQGRSRCSCRQGPDAAAGKVQMALQASSDAAAGKVQMALQSGATSGTGHFA